MQQQEIIPAYGHSYPDKWSVIVNPTCEDTGFAVKVCFECHEVIGQVVDVVDHKDNDGDGKCDTCKTADVEKPEEPAPEKPEDPAKDCDCNCHKGGIKGFFFKILLFFQKIFRTNQECKCGEAHY